MEVMKSNDFIPVPGLAVGGQNSFPIFRICLTAGFALARLRIAVCLAIANAIVTRNMPLKVVHEKHAVKEYLAITWRALPTLLLPIIILGGIYGGIFTPTESATVGVLYSLVLAGAYRKLKLATFVDSLKKTFDTSAMICFLIAGASVFCWILSTTQIPAKLADLVVPLLGGNQALYWILLLLILVFIGCVMESLASVVMLAPVLVPIGLAIGIDPIQLGVIFCVTLMSVLSPRLLEPICSPLWA